MMKNAFPILAIIFTISCSSPQQDANSQPEEVEQVEEIQEVAEQENQKQIPFSEVVYLIDTIADNYEIKELKSYRTFTPSGETLQKSYSFENPDGMEQQVSSYALPGVYAEMQSKYEGSMDTTILIENKEIRINKEGKITYLNLYWQVMKVETDTEGRWNKAIIGTRDEVMETFSWVMVERDFQKNIPEPRYLTGEGQDLIQKEKKSIVDYYTLMIKSGALQVDYIGGSFDVRNGYFEFSDEGTGAGIFTTELALFKDASANDLLVLNRRSAEPLSYTISLSSDGPYFYRFSDGAFQEEGNVFPALDKKRFFSADYSGTTDIAAYFTLPRRGLSITYHVNQNMIDFCENELKANQEAMGKEQYAEYERRCEMYASLATTKLEIPFNKSKGIFELK